MAENIEGRFERYCDGEVSALAHADRREAACRYPEGVDAARGGRGCIPGCVLGAPAMLTWWPTRKGVMRRCWEPWRIGVAGADAGRCARFLDGRDRLGALDSIYAVGAAGHGRRG